MTRKVGDYKPDQKEIQHLIPRENMLKVSGDGVFATLQGEGVTAGTPAIFLRLHYCNLSCGYNGGWKCDTSYTWNQRRPEYWKEPEDWDIEETVTKINTAWENAFGKLKNSIPRLVITGGEPLLQQKGFLAIIKRLPGWKIEIETNGTLKPLPQLSKYQFNCSPKLANSGNSLDRRLKPIVLAYINSFNNSWFKFVARSPKDLIEIDRIVESCSLNPQKVLIMPEGHTAETVKAHAKKLSQEVENRGWKLTMRNQLIWYGPKRKT